MVIAKRATRNRGHNAPLLTKAKPVKSITDNSKPSANVIEGIQAEINRINGRALRCQTLTRAHSAGYSGSYTTLANEFDQNIKPSMMPILGMSGAAQRTAVQAAVKANPALRSNFEWAYNHGMLK